MDDVPFLLWDRQGLYLSADGSSFCLHSLASVARPEVAVDSRLHVVEDVSAPKDLEGLATSRVAGRHGVVTTRDDFFHPDVGHQDSVIVPILAMVECRARLRVLYFPWILSCDGLNLLLIV